MQSCHKIWRSAALKFTRNYSSCVQNVTSHLSLHCQRQIWVAFTSKTEIPPAMALVFDTIAFLRICQAAPPDPLSDLLRQECEDTRSSPLGRDCTSACPGPKALSLTLFSVGAGFQGLGLPRPREVKNPCFQGPLCSLLSGEHVSYQLGLSSVCPFPCDGGPGEMLHIREGQLRAVPESPLGFSPSPEKIN